MHFVWVDTKNKIKCIETPANRLRINSPTFPTSSHLPHFPTSPINKTNQQPNKPQTIGTPVLTLTTSLHSTKHTANHRTRTRKRKPNPNGIPRPVSRFQFPNGRPAPHDLASNPPESSLGVVFFWVLQNYFLGKK